MVLEDLGSQLVVAAWNVLEFPCAPDMVLDGISPYCCEVCRVLGRPEERVVLLEAMAFDRAACL